jgi:hypothetical protein
MESTHQQESQYRIGPGYIEAAHLVLMSLKHVSKGSWQPEFRVIRRDLVKEE